MEHKASHKDEQQVETVTRLQQPSLFHVVLLNDDFTPMDFVVLVLIKIFQRNNEEAQQIMLQIHNQGKGIAGTYPRSIAETKLAQLNHAAVQAGFPLSGRLEKED